MAVISLIDNAIIPNGLVYTGGPSVSTTNSGDETVGVIETALSEALPAYRDLDLQHFKVSWGKETDF
ncbi:hypothetical protein M514_02023 [Trichuris suis]|uniref:Uncharacterized protein n=1 Tax=Trichuris suis TaxID=68888 RepID=A0A085N284_9BILA|nr:hypothetical protein M513_02023 [Trichuris suis]KFD63580.1 hypothetical protein M514_02023 [Trichuris suis]